MSCKASVEVVVIAAAAVVVVVDSTLTQLDHVHALSVLSTLNAHSNANANPKLERDSDVEPLEAMVVCVVGPTVGATWIAPKRWAKPTILTLTELH